MGFKSQWLDETAIRAVASFLNQKNQNSFSKENHGNSIMDFMKSKIENLSAKFYAEGLEELF